MRFSILSATVLLLAFAAGASAKDEACSLEMDSLKPVLLSNANGVQVTGKPVLDQENHTLKQSISLRDGTEIAFQTGGCEHFAYTLSFRKLPNFEAKKSPMIFASIQAVLKNAPLVEDGELNKKAFMDIVRELKISSHDKGAWENDHTLSAAGEATETLVLVPGGFDLSYDFPL